MDDTDADKSVIVPLEFTADDHDEISDIVDQMQELGVSRTVDITQVVVHSNRNSGQSSTFITSRSKDILDELL
ncbi:uncharacterized protein AB675_4382 [Cyphellophora attinorum]|uniref:Uncharacterized protein n=1 Tax=Cyphellophora attinorum TaxID=1664694 RepID=A0A0N1NY84_9EURO|nr:uncharacterized protein AB675_4382 [Phialophora attinorum]KPI36573.1 hypothetical protein AB675_4382 [Phialophora attinorum]